MVNERFLKVFSFIIPIKLGFFQHQDSEKIYPLIELSKLGMNDINNFSIF